MYPARSYNSASWSLDLEALKPPLRVPAPVSGLLALVVNTAHLEEADVDIVGSHDVGQGLGLSPPQKKGPSNDISEPTSYTSESSKCILDFWTAAPEAHLGEADIDVVGSHDVGQGDAVAHQEGVVREVRLQHPQALLQGCNGRVLPLHAPQAEILEGRSWCQVERG